MRSPIDIVAELRDKKEQEALQKQKLIVLLCDLGDIAFPAIYNAAGAGNVTCRKAVTEIEKIFSKYTS